MFFPKYLIQNNKTSNISKNRPVEPEFYHVEWRMDRQTDMMSMFIYYNWLNAQYYTYGGGDKSLARPERKQATATKRDGQSSKKIISVTHIPGCL